MLPWMIYTLLVTALIGAAAIAAERAASMLAVPTRVVWCGALAATAIASGVSWRAASSGRSILVFSVIAPLPATPRTRTGATVARDDRKINVVAQVSVGAVLTATWVGLSVLGALFLGVTTARLRGRRRVWTRADVNGERVFITDGLGPAVVGFFRPVIALPGWAMNGRDDSLCLIIAHEREHLRAGDQRVLAVAWIVVIALPWNAIALWMIARLRHAIEIDCDARVMRGRRDVRAYGELLIEVSRRPALLATGLTAFAERPSNVERRIMALTTRMPKNRKAIVTGLTLAAATAALVACEIPRPVGPGARGGSAMKVSQPVAVETPAPLPAGAAAAVSVALARTLPAVNATGTTDEQAVWFIADRNGALITSWMGPTFTEAEFRRVALQPLYDSLDLVPFNVGVKANNGAAISVVWARDVTPWEGYEYVNDRMRDLMRDSIRVLQPALYSALSPGQAVYFVPDWKTHRVERIWAAPALGDRKTQWEYARSQFPERVILRVTNVVVTAEDGRQIPVVYLDRRPWSERY